jgi:hypothetical protein
MTHFEDVGHAPTPTALRRLKWSAFRPSMVVHFEAFYFDLRWYTLSDRRQAVAATLGLSLRRLSPVKKARCTELSIFPEDVPVPLAVVSDLWHTTKVEGRRTLRHLADLGLINLDLQPLDRHPRCHPGLPGASTGGTGSCQPH